MKEWKKLQGSVTVEAAMLFPMVLILMVSGFTLMIHWYSQWENRLEQHRREAEEMVPSENLRLLHWEQWGELLEETWNEGER